MGFCDRKLAVFDKPRTEGVDLYRTGSLKFFCSDIRFIYDVEGPVLIDDQVFLRGRGSGASIEVTVTHYISAVTETIVITIDGKDGYFNVSMYAMSVGTRANDLNQNWQIYSCTDKSLSVINNSNKTQYKLTRVTEE